MSEELEELYEGSESAELLDRTPGFLNNLPVNNESDENEPSSSTPGSSTDHPVSTVLHPFTETVFKGLLRFMLNNIEGASQASVVDEMKTKEELSQLLAPLSVKSKEGASQLLTLLGFNSRESNIGAGLHRAMYWYYIGSLDLASRQSQVQKHKQKFLIEEGKKLVLLPYLTESGINDEDARMLARISILVSIKAYNLFLEEGDKYYSDTEDHLLEFFSYLIAKKIGSGSSGMVDGETLSEDAINIKTQQLMQWLQLFIREWEVDLVKLFRVVIHGLMQDTTSIYKLETPLTQPIDTLLQAAWFFYQKVVIFSQITHDKVKANQFLINVIAMEKTSITEVVSLLSSKIKNKDYGLTALHVEAAQEYFAGLLKQHTMLQEASPTVSVTEQSSIEKTVSESDVKAVEAISAVLWNQFIEDFLEKLREKTCDRTEMSEAETTDAIKKTFIECKNARAEYGVIFLESTLKVDVLLPIKANEKPLAGPLATSAQAKQEQLITNLVTGILQNFSPENQNDYRAQIHSLMTQLVGQLDMIAYTLQSLRGYYIKTDYEGFFSPTHQKRGPSFKGNILDKIKEIAQYERCINLTDIQRIFNEAAEAANLFPTPSPLNSSAASCSMHPTP